MTIYVDGITKKYGGKNVLDNLNMVLPEGKVTALMGKSGSGKTTLANLMLGLIKPDEGKIEGLEGKKLSAVFQEDRLCEHLSAVENVRLVVSGRASKEEIIKQLEALGVDRSHAVKPVNQLSGGQKRRVAILRAMMAESDFICLDEPFKGLDSDTKENTMSYVKNAVKGKTVLLITHDKNEAAYFGETEGLSELSDGIKILP